MRVLIPVLSLAILVGCSADKQQLPAGFVKRTVTLVKRPYVPSPTGTITLNVPVKYDTLLVWLDVSDNQMSHKPKYRFTSSKGCLLQESGFFKWEGTYCQDSLDRLTIETQMNYGSEETLEAVERRIRNQDERNKAVGAVPTVWKSKKLATINGRIFSIVEFFGVGSLVAEPYRQIVATTTLRQADRGWEVRFQFDCKRKQCANFARDVYTTIQSIRIDSLASHREQ